MKRIIVFFVWVVCFAGSCVSVTGQDKPLSEVGFHFVRNYSVDDYKASPQNWSVVQDRRGVMYFANTDGILEFDGLHWRLIKVKNGSPVGALAVDPKTGRIYVGAIDEFGYLTPDPTGQLQYESLRNLVPPNTQAIHLIHKILITPSEVFFRPEDQVVRWDGHQITLFSPTTSEDWYGRAFQIGDRIVVRHQSHGLIEWKQGKFELIPGSERFGQLGVYTILPFDPNRWLLFTAQGMMLYDGLAFTPFVPEMTAFLKAVVPYDGLVLPDGRFAINTLNNGVVILNRQGRVDEIINKASGLADNAVKYLYLDREGGLWAAMETGLARIEISQQLTFFDERSGLQGLVTAITRYKGELYVATVSGVYKARSATESSFLELTSLRTPTFLKIEGLSTQCWVFEQIGDQLLVASNDGIYRIDQLKATLISPISTACLFQSAHFPGKLVVPDRNGRVFLLTWKQNQWAIESELFDIKAEPTFFREMPAGEWWIATKTNGLNQITFDSHQLDNKTEIRNLQVKNFGIPEGLPALEVNYPLIVHNRLLVGTRKGLFEFDPGTHRFQPASGFITEPGALPIARIALDANGIVWGNFDKEPQVLDEQLVGRWIPQTDGSARWQRSQLGLVPDGLVMNFFAEPDQTVWICSVRGLFRYSPDQKAPTAQEIPLLLRLFKADQKTVWFEGTNFSDLSAIPTLEYVNNRINMAVAGLTFSLETPPEYQFKLDGVDANWLPWSRQPFKEYTNLWEGSYQLRLRARNIYGQMSREVLFSFKVFPPWYRTWWAYGFYFVAVASVGYGGINWRLKILRRRNEELEQLVALRTSELKDKVQELAQKNEELQVSQRQADRIFTAFTEALPGTVLDGKYRLDIKIGAGGFGAVFRATQMALDRKVAIKVFRPTPGHDSPKEVERFRREGISSCRVNHPNAVSILDSGISSDGIAYLVMELLNGHTLARELKLRRRLSLKRCAAIINPLCDALSAAHQAGIIHRDIKPENVFLHKIKGGEVVKILDFGIAKLVGEGNSNLEDDLTATGGIIGTPAYMAPERLNGTNYDHRVDIYSLGIMLFEMVTGNVPFTSTGRNLFEVLFSHFHQEVPSIKALNLNLPEEVEALIQRALKKNPEERISLAELAAELNRIAAEFLESEDSEPGSSQGRITDVEYYSTTALEQLETMGIPIEQRETLSPPPSQLNEPRQPSGEVNRS